MRTMAAVISRIASASSVRRTRDEDAARLARNGGHSDELYARVQDAVRDLETAARKLEALIAD